jgi:hypothetical protein
MVQVVVSAGWFSGGWGYGKVETALGQFGERNVLFGLA